MRCGERLSVELKSTYKTAGRRAAIVTCALMLGACAGVEGPHTNEYDETELWESSVVQVRRIDVRQLADADNRSLPELSGFISSVAARGDDLFFVDQGAGKLMHVSLAAMSVRELTSLRNPSAAGLYASIDGTVYVVDSFNRQVVRLDPLHGEIDRIPVDHVLANPIDIVVAEDEHVILVLDALDGRIATLDALGGLQQINEPRAFQPQSVLSASVIGAGAGGFYLLDKGVDEIVGFSFSGHAVGSYGSGDLERVSALTADACGRLFVTDRHDGSLYIGFADMSLPGRRVTLPELRGTEVSDLWTDGSFLYVATRADGIYVFLVDPECGS
jgi:hypothetical protein